MFAFAIALGAIWVIGVFVFGATSRIHGKMCPVELAHFFRLIQSIPLTSAVRWRALSVRPE